MATIIQDLWDFITNDLDLSTAQAIIATLLAGGTTFGLARAVYNVSPLHPLSHIPGPKLNAMTYLPEFFHDTIRFGKYTSEIAKMHETYGPIVRINPDEVHCNDPKFANEIFPSGGRKRDKVPHQVRGSAIEYSGFSTVDHDRHRQLRGPVAKFFSRTQVTKLEPQVAGQVQRLCSRLLAWSGREPLDLASAYSCFTSDVISGYSFGQSFGFLDRQGPKGEPVWEPNYHKPVYSLLQTVFLFRYFPFLKHTSLAAVYLTSILPEDMGLFIKTLMVDIPSYVRQTQADLDSGVLDPNNNDKPTVFASLLNSDLPEELKTVTRLSDEAAAVLNAGTETTSWTVAIITYYLLAQPATLARLTAELQTVVSDPLNLPRWAVLEKLPFLSAVIQEALRLSYGVSARTGRVPTAESLLYKGEMTDPKTGVSRPVQYVIPQDYGIGMSAVITHHNEKSFPNSHTFDAERWLFGEDAEGVNKFGQTRRELDDAHMSFGKGSRGCLGINLAQCELYLLVTALTLRVLPHMELFETTEEDVKYDRDMFIPLTKSSSKGVRVTIS
ncbi:trichodiene oxygenase [Microdochium bolleyi]|uniref:Trichodiene oxygenase n=1 Tax=Microdochium bolleyi TaxID=196109 RepID=A0A136IV18_9PEZI|nr:trichodiene oxygenase [Microdochium bolleyi]